VFFRMGARQQATRLGLTGWVRNLADGRVEGMARGEPAALSEFRAWLAVGPGAARVTAVDWAETATEEFNGFTVR
jgi:acylphosphatase